MKDRVILLFSATLFATILYAAFWAKVFTNDWSDVSFVSETPLAIIVALIAPMIFITRKNLPPGQGRVYLARGFSGLLVLILFVMAVEKYSFVFPTETAVFYLHPVEPIIFTISVLFILRGISKLVSNERLISNP